MQLKRRGGSGLPPLFGLQDAGTTGRSCMMMSSLLTSVITWLSGSMFYTSFLMANGINIVNVGIISFIPFIANCFSIFSPSILERFAKRKWLLAGGRAMYYLLNLLGITLLPLFVKEPGLRLTLFVVLTFAANIVNALFSSGYSVWHIHFIPDTVRARYFSVTQMITSFCGQTAALASSFLADALSSSGYQDTAIVIFRYVALALGLLEVFILTRPKEYPYKRSADRPRFRDIFTKPLTSKPFARTMLVIFGWNLVINLPAGSLNYYLLDTVGVSYTFVNAINMLYPFAILLLMKPAQRMVRGRGWFRSFGRMSLLVAPTNILYTLVTGSTYLWLMPIVRLLQHGFGVAHNLAYANLPYLNLPPEDQTNYMSFHTLTVNIGAFVGMMLGTWFVKLSLPWQLMLGPLPITGVQLLLLLNGLGQGIIGCIILKNLKKLDPASEV